MTMNLAHVEPVSVARFDQNVTLKQKTRADTGI